MTARRGSDVFSTFAILLGTGLCVLPAFAQPVQQAEQPAAPLTPAQAIQRALRPPSYIVPQGTEISTLYVDGSQEEIQIEDRWRFVCGSNTIGMTSEDLQAIAEAHAAEMADGPAVIVDSGQRGAGINIVFSLGASVPAAAIPAFAMAESYIESKFANPITVTVTVSFANMGGGVLGATGSSFVNNVTYTNARNGLINGMDANDTIQTSLPSGATLPVRYNGASATVTNEAAIDFTRANYRATIGTTTGNAASMQYNNQFSWDFDPSNGINAGTYSFVDVVIHEVGHALGFVSGADSTSNQTDALDLFRFTLTDGAGDYNPDNAAEFSTTPRTIDFNTPNDDAIIDFITVEYRMSDGDPYQASHFREQAANIGIMDPAFSPGQTFYPNHYKTSDLNAFDAIGYDYPPCTGPTITTQPQSQVVCVGGTVSLSVATNGDSPTYQWFRVDSLLTDGGRISGATTGTLTITGTVIGDMTSYHAVVSVNGCPSTSNDATLTPTPPPTILQQPQDQIVTAGESMTISVVVQNPDQYTYRWLYNGLPIFNNGRITGTASTALTINPITENDAGFYACRISPEGDGCTAGFSDSAAANVTVLPGGGCPADLDGSGDVGLQDLATLLAHFGSTNAAPQDGDLDGDSDVDLQDLATMLAAYGSPC
jgi:hypothetical protein